MTKAKKVFLSHKIQDKIYYFCKIYYLIKIFNIILPNLDPPRPGDKNMAKNRQSRLQIKLKLPHNTN